MFHLDGPDAPPTQDKIEFAIRAWTIARAPVMAPGYVTARPRIQDTTVHWDDHARAAVAVQIALPAPAAAHRIPSHWHGWLCLPASQRWVAPDDNNHATVLTTLTVRIPLAAHDLPTPRYQAGAARTTVAKRAVTSLCETLNAELAGVLAASDTAANTPALG